MKKFYPQKKHKKPTCNFSLRYFYTPKTHKKQTSIFHSDISMCLKNIKNKQTSSTQIFLYAKKHKKHTSIFHSDIFMRLKSIKCTQTSNFLLRYSYVSKKHKKQTSNFLFIKCIKSKQATFRSDISMC